MRRITFLVQITAFLLFSGCTDTQPGIKINDLRCENLSGPLGIATTTPRFSWKMISELNGKSQKAYQILVASDSNLLDEKKTDLWNSGKILSSESVMVRYQGKELPARSACFWKVRVWDENDNKSDWSIAEGFSIGLLNNNEWKASYISFPDKSVNSVSPQFRRTFNVNAKGDRVFLHVNSLGYHEVFLNGEKVGKNVLTPAVSQFNKRSLAITYDITSLIKAGRNDIVLWIGRGWYTKGLPGVLKDGPMVRAQIEELNKGKWETIICTDSLWTGRNSGYYCTGTWRPADFGGERVDGSLLLKDMSSSSLDATSWSPVSVTENSGYEVTPQMTEPNRILKVIKPDTLKLISADTWLIDLGTTLTGFAEIRFPKLNPGQEIIMEYSDHLDINGNIVDQGQEDQYVATGDNGETFSNKFNYHGFRYIKISNLKEPPGKDDISAYLIHTNYRLASSFQCSDPDMNRIHDMIFYTLRCLSLGGDLVDCPQIERLGYGGDGNASTETAQTMFDLDPLYNNWLQAWADCIRDDGGMPHTAPNPYPAGGGPYWCGFIITASWKTFVNYGDLNILEKYYPVMQKWLGYVDKYSPDVLLEPWPETDYRGWYLGDWATPDGIDQTNQTSIKLVNNCFITVCYSTMEKIAGVLGKSADKDKYSIKKKQIAERIHKELFDPINKIYGSGSQIDLTYPMLAGIVPDTLVGDVKKNLFSVIEIKNNGHIACGLVGIPVFTEWVVKDKQADLMYSILKKKDYPGYLYMIENGATTTWEHWNGARSRIHNCYNGIGSWFYKALGGLQTDENFPGYQNLIIDPQIPKGVTWAKVSKETPYGTVSVNWKVEDKVMNLQVYIPVGCTAKVAIPEGVSNYIFNDENFIEETSYVEIESGENNFVFNLNL